MELKKPDFDLDELRQWTKDEIIEWYADGQYTEFIYDPPAGEPDPEKRRRCVLARPRNRAQRKKERGRLVSAMEFHAGVEIANARRRLASHGVKDPSRATLELEVMLSADVRSQDLIDALQRAVNNWFDRQS